MRSTGKGEWSPGGPFQLQLFCLFLDDEFAAPMHYEGRNEVAGGGDGDDGGGAGLAVFVVIRPTDRRW